MSPSNRVVRFHRTLLALAIATAMSGCASWPLNFTGGNSLGLLGPETAGATDRGLQGLRSGESALLRLDYDIAKLWIEHGQFNLALQALDRVLATNPGHAEALNVRASIHVSTGEYEKAQRDLAKAIMLAPERAHLHLNLGLLLVQRGDRAMARLALERAQAIDPGHPRVRQTLASLSDSEPSKVVEQHQARITGADIPRIDFVESQQQTGSGHQALVRITDDSSSPDAVTPPIASSSPSIVEMTGLESGRPRVERVAADAEEVTRIVRVTGAQVVSAAQDPGTPAVIAIAPSVLESTRIDIANGNGITGLARVWRGQLRAVGVQTASISNWSNFQQPVTRILYRDGYEDAARALAHRLPVNAELVSMKHLPRADRDVMVVLGRDMRAFRATASGWESLAGLADFPAA